MKRILFIGLCVVVSLLVLGATAFRLKFENRSGAGPSALNRIKQVPEFLLTRQDEKPFGTADLKGKVWVADFIYSTCPGPCPMISTNFAELQEPLMAASSDVQMVSISIDPKHDTPEVLRRYAEAYGAKERWHFLTGDPVKVLDLVNKGFLISVVRPEGQEIIHGTHLALVDRDGWIRKFYNGEKAEDLKSVVGDVKLLLNE
jgi:protein SCO1/2